ncbi:hypothetical protein ABPG72_015709 [Tetrahymena utriculariae]
MPCTKKIAQFALQNKSSLSASLHLSNQIVLVIRALNLMSCNLFLYLIGANVNSCSNQSHKKLRRKEFTLFYCRVYGVAIAFTIDPCQDSQRCLPQKTCHWNFQKLS